MAGTPEVRSRRWLPVRGAAIFGALALLAGAADRGTWDFRLPTVAGDRFVRLSDIPGPVLVNFWGSFCPPCVEELPRLQAFAGRHPNWTVLLVCTEDPRQARGFLQQHQVTLTALRAGVAVTALLRSAGDPAGALPFTVVLRDHRILLTHLGGLSATDMQALVAAGEAERSR